MLRASITHQQRPQWAKARERLRRGDPLQHDRNGDGQLTFAELAVRYALRRLEREESDSTSGDSRDSDPSNSRSSNQRRSSSNAQGNRSSERGTEDRARQIAEFYEILDADRNGRLEPHEYRDSRNRSTIEKRLRESGFGLDQSVPINELVKRRLEAESQRISQYYRELDLDHDGQIEPIEYRGKRNVENRVQEAGFVVGSSVSVDRIIRKRLEAAGLIRISYRIRTVAERLPPNLPAWFTDRDENLDGQIQMSEFESQDRWTEARAQEFRQYDLNDDGIIIPAECLIVTNRKAGKSANSDDRHPTLSIGAIQKRAR